MPGQLTHKVHHPLDGDSGVAPGQGDRDTTGSEKVLRAFGSHRIFLGQSHKMQAGDVHIHVAHWQLYRENLIKGGSNTHMILQTCDVTQATARDMQLLARTEDGQLPNVYFANILDQPTGGEVRTSVFDDLRTGLRECALRIIHKKGKWRRLRSDRKIDSGSENEVFDIAENGKEIILKQKLPISAQILVTADFSMATGNTDLLGTFSSPQIDKKAQTQLLPIPKTPKYRKRERARRRSEIKKKV